MSIRRLAVRTGLGAIVAVHRLPWFDSVTPGGPCLQPGIDR